MVCCSLKTSCLDIGRQVPRLVVEKKHQRRSYALRFPTDRRQRLVQATSKGTSMPPRAMATAVSATPCDSSHDMKLCSTLESITLGLQVPPQKVFGHSKPIPNTFLEGAWIPRVNKGHVNLFFLSDSPRASRPWLALHELLMKNAM